MPIRHADLIDGTARPRQPNTFILIRDGRIREISREIAAPDVPTLDVENAIVTAGLIDAHVQSTRTSI